MDGIGLAIMAVLFFVCILPFCIKKFRLRNEYNKRIEYYNSKNIELSKEEALVKKNLASARRELDECSKLLDTKKLQLDRTSAQVASCELRLSHYNSLLKARKKDLDFFNEQLDILNAAKSNLTAIPYMASIMADFQTHGIELLAQKLDWGSSQERLKKVQSLREIRRETKEVLTQYKTAQYQLEYAVAMFPSLADFFETDYHDLPILGFESKLNTNNDPTQNYLSLEEYSVLSSVQRNQLALDRYRQSHNKTKWQIGRDYELYVGYKYEQKGYQVDYFGAYNGLEDLGRDLIARKNNQTLIIQCKYWSSKKLIHEKHITQLYGTLMCYCFENSLSPDNVHGIIVTNITVSSKAKEFAAYLGIQIVENYALGNYPCIKCNINRTSDGEVTKIYHLPFDQQYDSCKIDSPGEFMAMTVAEAEQAGFRRAFRWHNN